MSDIFQKTDVKTNWFNAQLKIEQGCETSRVNGFRIVLRYKSASERNISTRNNILYSNSPNVIIKIVVE